MRVIIWGINYTPEPTGIAPYLTGLAEHLRARGDAVTVVTAFPYYPQWRKAPADAGRWHRREEVNGVTVHRCWHYVPERPSALRRILHEASFVATSLWRVLRLARPDLYVVVSPPLGLGVAAALVTRLKRRPGLLHVQDLQPDSAAGLGMVRPGFFLRCLYAAERFAYRGAAGVGGISAGMTAAFGAKGLPAEKVFLLPNWRRPLPGATARAAADFRLRHDLAPEAFVAVYAGNLGRKQGLEAVLDAADLLADDPGARRLVVVIAGEGAMREQLAERLASRPRAGVRLLPLQTDEGYAAMLAAADLGLITQMPGTGRVCFPSKLLSVLAAGRPVITASDDTSDLARAVGEGGFGCNVPAGDAPALARALRAAACDPAQVAAWAARTNWVNKFSAAVVLPRFEAVLRALAFPTPVAQLAATPGALKS